MDAKTFEYMNQRTQKYKELSQSVEKIDNFLGFIYGENSVEKIETRYSILEIPKGSEKRITASVIKVLESEKAELKKEMEEI